MTQTTLPSTTPPTPHSAGPDDASGHQDGRHLPVTLWLFGLTAMTLVFASLLLLGLLVPVGRVDGSVMRAVSVYTAVTSIIGLVALGYVLTVARRSGYLGPQHDSESVPTTPTATAAPVAGLSVAPSTPAAAAPRLQQKAAQAKQARTQQARAIAAATTPRRPQMPVVGVPPVRANVVAISPTQAARPVHPAAPPAVHTSARVAPKVSKPAPRPSTPAPRPNKPAPRASKPAPGANRGVTIPVGPPRPTGTAPAWLRMGPPARGVRTQPAVFQVRSAAIRTPFWEQPQSPTLVDRFLGRGTHRPSMPPVLPPSVAPPVHRAPQPTGSR